MLVKAFRLFVSSTFRDFELERNLLQEEVFPALDAYCAARGYQFYPLDLRWGVSEEAQLDQRTSEICLGEVDAANTYPPPNFLIMLGNRYGWVPLPYAIAQDEFEAIKAWLKAHNQPNAAGAFGAVYELDSNHRIACGLLQAGAENAKLTGAYTLRSREEETRLKPREAWEEFSSALSRVLQIAANGLFAEGRIGPDARDKYFISLTGQEILHGLRGYRTAPDGASPGVEAGKWLAATAFIREIVNGSAAANPGYIEENPRLDLLKETVKGALPKDNIVAANVALDESGELTGTHLPRFAKEIETALKAAIDLHIARVEAMEREPDFALKSEREAHSTFAKARLKVFVGRKSNVAAIKDYLEDSSNAPLVIHGRSGLGKSALMARAVEEAEAAKRAPVVARFIGASAASSNLRPLLTSLVEDLAERGIVSEPEEFEQDIDKFNNQIANLLASIENPAVIFLDALDQLQKPHILGWLPREPLKGLKLVLSVLDDPAYEVDSGFFRSLKTRLPENAFLETEPLSAANGNEILSELSRQSGRGLQDGQRDYIAAKFEQADASPLYLKTAFEVAKSWKSGTHAGEGDHVLADDTAGVIAQFIEELTSVHHHEHALVTRALGYLTAARNGLSEKELTEVLSRDDGVMKAIFSEKHDAHTKKLPPSVWVRLNRALAPFLVDKQADEQPLLNFFHRQVAQVARERHYESTKSGLHFALAAYFESQATKQGGRAVYRKRSLSELPFQLNFAGEARRLDGILESPDWIQQKFFALGSQVLVNDYEQFGRSPVQNLIGRTLLLTSGICSRDKWQLLPQLHGRLKAQAFAAPFRAACLTDLKKPAILTSRASLTPPSVELARLEGHDDGVTALAALPDGRLASGSWDKTIRLWDLKVGTETARLEGHDDRVNALAVLTDGRLASGSDDKTIRLWDLRTGQEAARLEGHDGSVCTLALLPDGQLASGSWDKTIRLWDLKSGKELARLEGHSDRVNALAFLPDGRLASGSGNHSSLDGTIRLWDLKSSKEAGRLEGHQGSVNALAVLTDGRLASGSDDKTIRLWDLKTGQEVAKLEGHCPEVSALAALPHGRLAAGVGTINIIGRRDSDWTDQSAIIVWNTLSGIEIARLEKNMGGVWALAALPGGRLASGFASKTIRIWDASGDMEAAEPEGHDGPVRALAALPDGCLASGAEDGTIGLWDAKSGVLTARLGRQNASVFIRRVGSEIGSVRALAVLPDGGLASGHGDFNVGGYIGADASIRLWDLKTGVEAAKLKGHGDRVHVLALLPDGRLASGSDDKSIRLWDLETRQEAGQLPLASEDKIIRICDLKGGLGFWVRHDGPVNALAPLPGGLLASGSVDRTIRLWDLKNGGLEAGRLQGHDGSVNALAVLPDSPLASGSEDKSIRLWDLGTGAELARLEGHGDEVTALAFMLDGRLASAAKDRTIRLWNLKTTAEITRLEIDAAVLCLIALHDGRLVAGDALGRLHWLDILD